ncbi:MAG: two-component regulator propeller domain-containing protein, partial [Bacteroidia bacterium]
GAGNGLFTIFGVKEGLSNVGVQSLFEDRAGNFWIGTGAGLFLFDRSRANHPCTINTCKHNLKIKHDLNEHREEQAKTFINVTKKGPWPQQFR